MYKYDFIHTMFYAKLLPAQKLAIITKACIVDTDRVRF